ncbi:MAG: hypothetical protein HKN26_12025 [Acidimicrobiales bacterium]|nr:hypothetical protein [Acidimicrobiales bacterium]
MSSRPYIVVAVPALALALVVLVVLGLAGVPWLLAVLLGLVAGLALAWWLLRSPDKSLLQAWGATPLTGEPIVENLVSGLVVTHGFTEPEVAVVSSPGRNSALLATQTGAPTLVLTTGLLECTNRIELEAILARQLAVIRDVPVAEATLGAKLVRLAPSVGLARMLRNYLLGSANSFDADRSGALLIRYPPGLTKALETLAEGSTEVKGVNSDSAHLWLADPGAVGASTATATHPALTDRITFLREL